KSLKLNVDLGGLAMKNPVTVASGTFGSGREFAELWDISQLGAVTTKGVSLDPWLGNRGVRITETTGGMLNSIGLQNPGVEAFCANDLAWLATQELPVIVNVCGHTTREYVAVIERLEQEAAVSAYEVNISCPNVDCGGMAFGTDPAEAELLTRACRAATRRPMLVKLSPNVTDITEIARACEAGGADVLTLINTVAGMAIDLKTRRSVFERGVAGLSGPAIKPVALWAIHRVYRAVTLPLLGVGGIARATDAIEFLLAGARAVALGTQLFTDPSAPPKIIEGIIDWCFEQGVRDVNDLVGGLS
ncbi:MAG: dihydroorotate dehydrogenase, partial [Coriobacteriales bacterium]|nr:dihydroorotate dehydrogenase [Coriobacteriales bacterium]